MAMQVGMVPLQSLAWVAYVVTELLCSVKSLHITTETFSDGQKQWEEVQIGASAVFRRQPLLPKHLLPLVQAIKSSPYG